METETELLFRMLKRFSFTLFAVMQIACASGRGDQRTLMRSDENILTPAQWRENVEFVVSSLKRYHPEPFRYSAESSFDRQIEGLLGRLDTLEDHEVLVALMSAVASIKDGHTAIRGGISFLSGQYPFQFRAFSDAVFLVAADSAHQEFVGAELVSIGLVSAQDALGRASRMTPQENGMTMLLRAPAFLSLPESLHALGLASTLERARFVFRTDSGDTTEAIVTPVSFDERLYSERDLDPAARQLYRQRRDRNYWHEMLPLAGVRYVQLNTVRDDPRQSIADFAAELADLESNASPNCVLLDVRANGGGNGYLNAPVIEWARNAPSTQEGRFFVAIGRGTFSAAQKLVTALELTTDVVFIVEPTGSRPNHFGDSETFALPHGDLTLSVSSIYWEDAGPDDARDALEPDIAAPERSDEYFNFVDPVLEAVIDRCG